MFINFIYFILAAIGIISAFLILTSLNPISRLAFLIIVFIMSAFLFIILDYYFLGLTYIIVYVGAIAILFLFVIMMAETLFTPTSGNIVFPTSFNKELVVINKIDGSFDGSGSDSMVTANVSKSSLVPGSALPGASQKPFLELSLPMGDMPLVKENNKEDVMDSQSLVNKSSSINLTPIIFLYLIDSLGVFKSVFGYIPGKESNFEIFNFFSSSSDIYNSDIWLYYMPNNTSEFLAFSDIQLLGFMIYLSFPLVTVLLGVLLWCVLIGVLRISGN